MPKKKSVEQVVEPSVKEINDGPVVTALKKRYFELLSTEKIGETKEITEEIDILEKEIKEKLNKK